MQCSNANRAFNYTSAKRPGGKLKPETMIGNAYNKLKKGLFAYFSGVNTRPSMSRSAFLTAAAFLDGQRRLCPLVGARTFDVVLIE